MFRRENVNCCFKVRKACVNTVCAVFTLLCIYTVCVLLSVLYAPSKPPVPETPTMCFNQTDIPELQWGDVTIPENITNSTVNNVTTYCGNPDQVITWLAREILWTRYDTASHPESKLYHELIPDTCRPTTKTETLIHLNALDLNLYRTSDRRKERQKDGQTILLWNTMVEHNVIGDIKYNKKDGAVVIQSPGRYFVKSQVSYKIETTDCNAANCVFKHCVYKVSAGGTEQTLVENIQSPSDPVSSEPVVQTSFVGSLFVLDKLDRLYVTISEPQFLVSEAASNYFIVFGIT